MTQLNSISTGPTTPQGPPIDLTERALSEIRKAFADEAPGDKAGLRVFVSRGGCSGMSYEMDFSQARPGDIKFNFDDVNVFIDAESSLFLKGSTLDYEGGLRGKGFVFTNPNASKTCSCGDSFRL
jgi:iron-sulfur cluster assembly protein